MISIDLARIEKEEENKKENRFKLNRVY
jgi:hypothetical protein